MRRPFRLLLRLKRHSLTKISLASKEIDQEVIHDTITILSEIPGWFCPSLDPGIESEFILKPEKIQARSVEGNKEREPTPTVH